MDLPELPPPDDVDAIRLQRLITGATGGGREAELGTTRALVAVHRGAIVAEGYGAGVDTRTTLPSWSMAKSILHAATGILVGRAAVDLHAPVAIPAWSGAGDERGAITLDHLLHMRSGLAWREDYVDGTASDVIEMLFGAGKADVAGYATSLPLAHPVDTTFCYSSGTSNIISFVTRRVVGEPVAYQAFLQEALFGPLDMRSPVPKFDAAGTWIASSYCFATARDFARFGLLYLRDGVWDGERVLPPGWVAHGSTPQPDVDDEGWSYGAHWWMLPGRTDGMYFASGYRGQYIVVVPGQDLVIVRSGDSDTDQRNAIMAMLLDVMSCFPAKPDR